MAFKEYICPRWPFYSLGIKVRFVDGWFATDDPALQAIVESNDMFGVRIWNAAGEDNAHGIQEEAETEGEGAAEALEGEINDQEGERGLPASQSEGPQSGTRSGEVKPKRGRAKGREASPVLSELEEIVRRSGIVSS